MKSAKDVLLGGAVVLYLVYLLVVVLPIALMMLTGMIAWELASGIYEWLEKQ